MKPFLIDAPKLIALVAVFCLIGNLSIWLSEEFQQPKYDFSAYYLASILLDLDKNPYQSTDRESEVWKNFRIPAPPPEFLYPVFAAWVLKPLAHLPFRTAEWLWTALNVLLLFTGILLLVDFFQFQPPWVRVLPFYLAMMITPVRYSLHQGQMNFLVFFLCAAAFWAFEKRCSWLSGGLLGIAAGLKMTPAFFGVFFLWRRDWKASGALAAGFALTLALPVLTGDGSYASTYFRNILPVIGGGTAYIDNQSLLGFLAKVSHNTTEDLFTTRYLPKGGFLHWANWGLSLAILAGALGSWRKRFESPKEERLRFSLFLVVLLLISPISSSHHYVLALIPLAVLGAELLGEAERSFLEKALLLAAVLLLCVPSNVHAWLFMGQMGWARFASANSLLAGVLLAVVHWRLLGKIEKHGGEDF